MVTRQDRTQGESDAATSSDDALTKSYSREDLAEQALQHAGEEVTETKEIGGDTLEFLLASITTIEATADSSGTVSESSEEQSEPSPAAESLADDGSFDTLLGRSERVVGRKRAMLLAEAAEQARSQLGDLSHAVALYSEAFEYAPGDVALIAQAEPSFDEAGRGAELTRKLVAQAAEITEKPTWVFLQRKVAQRSAAASDLEGAIQAYQALLEVELDVDALRALLELLSQFEGREAERAHALHLLASQVPAAEARELRFERARLLRVLGDLEGAKQALLTILGGGHDLEALERLAVLCMETADATGLAEVREKQLALAQDDTRRVELARNLADLYEGPLADSAKAVAVLELWTQVDSESLEPYFRLVPLLERAGRFEGLRAVYDALGRLASTRKEASAALLRAAEISMHELSDYEGAWRRLLPQVVDGGDLAAEETLRSLARVAGRGEQLAEVFVGLAQRATDAKQQTRRWLDAADTYEMLVGDKDKALEAALRAFATQMSDQTLLDEVDRLAVAAEAFPRLAQVYDALVRRAQTPEEATRVLMRHATLLEHEAHDPFQAFDRCALALSVDPHADEAYAAASRLGKVCARNEDLIAVHEQRALSAHDMAGRLTAQLEAARLSHHTLKDRERTLECLARALSMVSEDVDALERIEQTVKGVDQVCDDSSESHLLRLLCEAYAQRAEEEGMDGALATWLLQRAATLLELEEQDLPQAYRALERAAVLSPADETVLDALVELADHAQQHSALAVHLQRAVDAALDSNTACIALRRLGALYEGPLACPAKVVEVLRQLVMLDPEDLTVADRLRRNLKAVGEYTELLTAIERQLALVRVDSDRTALLEEAAEIWETALQNRFEAHLAWQRVLSAYPDHARAAEAVLRLGAPPSVNDLELLDGDLTVRPDDLRPSCLPAPPQGDAVLLPLSGA